MITRREFLTFVGVAAGGAALAYAPGAGVEAFEKVWGDDWVAVPKGPEKWVTSVCRQCPGGCGIRVRLIGARPVKIDGNPFHPVNRGRLCPKGQAGLLTLNDPDRIRGPLKRTGERGSGKWQAITWDEATALVVSRLKEMRSKDAAHTLAVLNGDSNGLTGRLLRRFAYQFGSPNFVDVPRALDYGTVDAFYLMQGIKESVAYDMAMANYVLSFGSGLLETHWSPVQAVQAVGMMRREKDIRGRIVQVESRYSVTAAKADEWVPVRPGTEGVLALGMAYFIIKDGLYDKEFIEKHTFGFEDWSDPSGEQHQGYRNFVLQNYSPAQVSDITGIPVDVIAKLSKEFATLRPAVAVGMRGDIYQQMAVHALNGLVGNIDKQGGVLTVKDAPDVDPPAPGIDETARRGLKMEPLSSMDKGRFPLADCAAFRFSERAAQKKPYQVNALFFYNCNPMFSRYVGDFSRALDNIPFVVSFSPYMDETTANSDLVLPDHTYLEKWEGSFSHTLQGFPVAAVGKPVVAPLYNTRSTADALIGIAQGVGGPLAKAFSWKDSKEALTETMKKLYDTSKGDLFAAEIEQGLLRELARRGWRAAAYKNFDEMWAGVQDKGGWWYPVYAYEEWERVLRTPSKKFEFYSQVLKNRLKSTQSLKGSGVEATGDQLFLPHWEPRVNSSPENEKDYPFHLKVYDSLVFAGSIHANDPYLQDINGFHTRERWHSWLEINPKTAEKLRVRDGDWVWVESPAGKLKLRAKVTPGAMPQVVNAQMGLGHRALGRWAKGIGEDAGRLIADHSEPFTGEPLTYKTRVKAYKA